MRTLFREKAYSLIPFRIAESEAFQRAVFLHGTVRYCAGLFRKELPDQLRCHGLPFVIEAEAEEFVYLVVAVEAFGFRGRIVESQM